MTGEKETKIATHSKKTTLPPLLVCCLGRMTNQGMTSFDSCQNFTMLETKKEMGFHPFFLDQECSSKCLLVPP